MAPLAAKRAAEKARRESRRSALLWSAAVVAVVALVGASVALDTKPEPQAQPKQPDPQQHKPEDSLVSPLPAPRVADSADLGGDPEYVHRMLWGSYRPAAFLGLRTRSPQGTYAGVAWRTARHSRHLINEHDMPARVGWNRHDGVSFGRQRVEDDDLHLDLAFAKAPGPLPASGRPSGGAWGAQVRTRAAPGPAAAQWACTLAYVGVEGEAGMQAEVVTPEGGDLLLRGVSPDVGAFEWHVHAADDAACSYVGLRASAAQLDRAVDQFWHEALQVRKEPAPRLPNGVQEGATLFVVQCLTAATSAMDVSFRPAGGATEDGGQERLEGDALAAALAAGARSFDERFERAFPGQAGSEFARTALSNMLGGMGYFHGRARVAAGSSGKSDQRVRDYFPASLFSGVPSRSFFPRGFLWDEGFHQLLVSRWDRRLTKDALAHWLDLMNADGWIPREVILGEEARGKLQFLIQKADVANPPTMLIPLLRLVAEAAPEDADFWARAYPRLRAWFAWFERTQVSPEGRVYWHGRSRLAHGELNPKTLSSGLDDYPRASSPGGSEEHLDLRCWLALAARLLAQIAGSLGDEADAAELLARAEHYGALDELVARHWHEADGRFYDRGRHTDDAWLNATSGLRELGSAPQPDAYVRHFGYVSLFPLATRLLPADAPQLGRLLDALDDPDELWTDYGLRSLALSSSFHGAYNTRHDAPYWRGAVWYNINYLVADSLQSHYGRVDGPFRDRARQLGDRLAANLVANAEAVFAKTSGGIYESYSDADGAGRGCRPFTGWTALAVLLG